MKLAENMRLSDIEELAAVTDLAPFESVIASVQRSDPQFLRAWLADGELICIAGCSPITHQKAAPWLLATHLLDKHLLRLTREAKAGVDDMLAVYPCLSNVIDIRQRAIIKWLDYLGFSFSSTPELKPGFGLVRFERVAHV